MVFYPNEIALIIKTLQFCKIKSYDKKTQNYTVKMFRKRVNETVTFINEQNETDWFKIKKSNYEVYHVNSLMKIIIPLDYKIVYLVRFALLKLFMKPLPHYQKYLLLSFKQSLLAQRIRLKKDKILIEMRKEKELTKVILQNDRRGLYKRVCQNFGVEKYTLNDVKLFYCKLMFYYNN
jgi:hypothetical protein